MEDLFNQLKEHHILAIEMAAKGCVSGTLKEWPFLLQAFSILAVQGNDGMRRDEMIAIASAIHEKLKLIRSKEVK